MCLHKAVDKTAGPMLGGLGWLGRKEKKSNYQIAGPMETTIPKMARSHMMLTKWKKPHTRCAIETWSCISTSVPRTASSSLWETGLPTEHGFTWTGQSIDHSDGSRAPHTRPPCQCLGVSQNTGHSIAGASSSKPACQPTQVERLSAHVGSGLG